MNRTCSTRPEGRGTASPWPPACGRAPSTSSSARSTSSGPGASCAAPSRPTSSPRSSSTARRAPARRPWPGSSPTPPRSHFITINAVLAGVKEIREAIDEAESRREHHGQRTILFVDEVHRWNKAQQDALLPWVENGTVILIGATTENPYFEVNRALVSRSPHLPAPAPGGRTTCGVVAAQPLADPSAATAASQVAIEPDALEHLVDVADGDARSLLNALELAVETTPAALPPPAGGDPHRPGRRRGEHPAARRALRQGRRLPLRHHQRLHQEPARLRPRRGALLAGAHGLRRARTRASSSGAC